MSINQEKVAQVYSWLRGMSGGKLTLDQVQAGDEIINCHGIDTLSRLLGYTLSDNVSGQFDISENGYSIIRQFEGFEAKAYKDTGGVWTIGYGTIKYPNGILVKAGDTCTRDEAESWLRSDSKWVDACLDKYVKVKVSQNQFDAMASFVYNIGESQFKSSTFLVLLNQGNFTGAANQLDRWVFDNGKRIQGLVNRRASEKALFLKK